MADSLDQGQCFISSTTATAVGGSNQTGLANVQVNASGANAPSGTTLSVIDGSGATVATFALSLPTALLTSYTGPVLNMDNLNIRIAYINANVTVKLSNALSSGELAVNVGYTY